MFDFVSARPGRCPSSEAEFEEREALLRELVPCRASRPEQLECPTALKCCELAGNHFCLPPGERERGKGREGGERERGREGEREGGEEGGREREGGSDEKCENSGAVMALIEL